MVFTLPLFTARPTKMVITLHKTLRGNSRPLCLSSSRSTSRHQSRRQLATIPASLLASSFRAQRGDNQIQPVQTQHGRKTRGRPGETDHIQPAHELRGEIRAADDGIPILGNSLDQNRRRPKLEGRFPSRLAKR